MLTAIHKKILVRILMALAVLGGAAMYQRNQAIKTAAAAAKAAEVLQIQKDDNEYLKQENEGLRKQVEANQKRQSSASAYGGKTRKTYIP